MRIVWWLLVAFVALTIAMNCVACYAERSGSVGISQRARLHRMVDWYPLILFRPG